MDLLRFILSFLLVTSLLSSTCVADVPGTYFDRIITIVLASTDYDVAMKDPYLVYLSKQGILLEDLHGVWHPSQPNYISMICASKSGMLTDFSQNLDGPSLPELLEEKGITWKAYLENYPGNEFKADVSEDKLYVRRHNPFISMNNIRNNSTMVSKIVNSKQLTDDIKKDNVPQYVFYVPNVNNNGEKTNLKTLLLITFDEAASYIDFNLENYNHIYATLIGPNVLNPFTHNDSTRYNHFSWVPTIEANWNLSTLGNSADTDRLSAVPLDPNLFL